LTINAKSGRITGTPTAAGNFTANISATNAGGTGSANLTIRVLPARPAITSAASANGSVGTALNFQVTASNNASRFSARGLPAGLTINATTGLITGTPTAAGNFSANISATNAGGTGLARLTIRVLPARPAITSATSASGKVGTPLTFQVNASNKPTSFGASSLPAGLTINAKSGRITGTPTTAGSFTANISATNAGGTGTGTINFTIAPRN
jgi:PKD repeat protein